MKAADTMGMEEEQMCQVVFWHRGVSAVRVSCGFPNTDSDICVHMTNGTLPLLQRIVVGSTYTYHLDVPALARHLDTNFLVQHIMVCEPIPGLLELELLDHQGPQNRSFCTPPVVLLVEGVLSALAVPFPEVSPDILVVELMLVLLWHFALSWRPA